MSQRLRQLGAIAAVLAVLAVASTAGTAGAVTFRDGFGIHVRSTQALDPRLLALGVSSAVLPGPANVRILLPSGYAEHPRLRYPVLYLLHGTSGHASDWTTTGDAERTTAGRPLIVVMPDIALNGDGGGWCTNWPNGQYKWETFHIVQLIPWVDRNLRTVRDRGGRAVAGLSQGGFCSMSYAARHPDLFSVALSYSGAPDIAYDAGAQALVTPVINATEVGLDHVAANSIFGDRLSNEINWAGHDPTTLAANLADTKLLLYTGNGMPGPLDPPGLNGGGSVIEGGVHALTQMFHERLMSLGIPSLYDDYGPGTHTWPYWARDLRQSIAPLMDDFAHPPRAPAQVTFTAAEATYAVYGWTVAMHRAVREFSTLRGASPAGFTLAGSGSGSVSTPAVYARAARYRVTLGTRTVVLRAGADRRLRIEVPLGPSNTVQEYPLDGPSTATKVYSTAVTIKAVKR